MFFLLDLSLLILSLPLLGLSSKSTSLSPGFCVRRPRQYDTICWELNLISGFFAFFWLIVWADGINKLWLVSCRRQGMLTQGPTPDPKCKLIISTFLTTSTSIILPHLCQGYHGHCIVTSSDGGMGRLGGGSFILGFGWGDRGWVYFFYFLFCFCAVVNCSFMAGT